MTSKWQQYKEKMGTSRPWDILNPNTLYVSEEVAKGRYSICLECPELIQITKQCKQCGCFMAVKSKLLEADCPLKKW